MHENKFFDRLVSVTKVGVLPVYDLTVPGVSQFVANGIVVHNCDYSGVELRIVTNLSKERLWLNEYFRCAGCDLKFPRGEEKQTPKAPPKFCPACGSDKIGDLHTLTALSIYGADAKSRPDWKQLRQNAKGVNFALCYGGSGQAVCLTIGCAKDEGALIKRKFDATYSGLQEWWEKQKTIARYYKKIVTAFGRWYPTPEVDHDDGFMRSKADRNAINAPIQGTSADITKISMWRIYEMCRDRGWFEKVNMLITMHDELVFEIDNDIIEEVLPHITKEMISNDDVLALGWPVPLTSDVELGHDWTVHWNIEDAKASGKWPAELVPLFPKMYAESQEQLRIREEKKASMPPKEEKAPLEPSPPPIVKQEIPVEDPKVPKVVQLKKKLTATDYQFVVSAVKSSIDDRGVFVILREPSGEQSSPLGVPVNLQKFETSLRGAGL
jgi:hypothetical protein